MLLHTCRSMPIVRGNPLTLYNPFPSLPLNHPFLLGPFRLPPHLPPHSPFFTRTKYKHLRSLCVCGVCIRVCAGACACVLCVLCVLCVYMCICACKVSDRVPMLHDLPAQRCQLPHTQKPRHHMGRAALCPAHERSSTAPLTQHEKSNQRQE